MAKSLGVFVTTPDCLHHLIGITKAAKNKGSHVKIFLTWKGTRLTQDKDFGQLCSLADDVSLCVDSYRKQGYDPEDIPPGLIWRNMATQAQHTIILEDFDYYLSL